jgi:DNA-binding MarR family transcriptional regulator
MKSSGHIKSSDYRALAEFRYQIRQFLRFSEEAARAAGLEPQQHQLLLAVKGLPEDVPATIGEMAERLQIQHHSTVELVDRMVRRGYVLRRRGSQDRRQVMLQLTAKGDRILRDLSAFHIDELRTLSPELVLSLRRLMATRGREKKSGAKTRKVAAK